MEFSVVNSINYNKYLAIGNLITCVYLPVVVLYLNYTDNLYQIGKYERTRLETVLFIAEVLKYFLCIYNQTKPVKKAEGKKFKVQNIFKGAIMMLSMTAIFYIGAVLFGAPVSSKQQETFTFAVIMTLLTALPCCLHLGPDNLALLFTSITSYEGHEAYKKFLMIIRLTLFGAWLGAVVIPLDWNRPYQEWPIPCCLGAIGGCFLANFILLLTYMVTSPTKKSFKV